MYGNPKTKLSGYREIVDAGVDTRFDTRLRVDTSVETLDETLHRAPVGLVKPQSNPGVYV